MSLATCSDGTCTHTGSVCGGPVAGTLTAGSNSFFTIEGVPAMVEDGDMVVPSHLPPSCLPPPESHAYSPTSLANSYFYIEGLRVVVLGDSYPSDPTAVDGTGSNTFVMIG